MTDITMWQDRSVREAFLARGEERFAEIRDQLPEIAGVTAIEPDSGDIFVGETLGQANEAARQQYLDCWLYFIRVDNPEAAIPLPVW